MQKNIILSHLVGHAKQLAISLFEEVPEITADTHFADIGMSSCDRAAIAADTLKSLSVRVPLVDILTASTLQEMVELIYVGAISPENRLAG